jgi:hypothetical protein
MTIIIQISIVAGYITMFPQNPIAKKNTPQVNIDHVWLGKLDPASVYSGDSQSQILIWGLR